MFLDSISAPSVHSKKLYNAWRVFAVKIFYQMYVFKSHIWVPWSHCHGWFVLLHKTPRVLQSPFLLMLWNICSATRTADISLSFKMGKWTDKDIGFNSVSTTTNKPIASVLFTEMCITYKPVWGLLLGK